MKSVAITVDSLDKSFGYKIVFSDFNAHIQKGQITVLFGPSGIGKTTLLKLITGLELPDKGSILVNNKTVIDKGKLVNEALIRQKIGIVFQDLYLWDNKTALDNIVEALISVKKLTKSQAIAKACKWTRLLNLDDSLLAHYPPHLSRGQRQRVAIARTLVMEPETILLDEPSASLNKELVTELIEILKQLRDQGKTVVVVTHDQFLAKKIGDETIYLG